MLLTMKGGGVSWKAADVATVAEVYSPALAAMMDREGLPARRRTTGALPGALVVLTN